MIFLTKTIRQYLILAFILITPLACASKMTPEEVTQSFWQAVEQNNNQALKNLMTATTDFDGKISHSVSDIQTSKVIMDDGIASVTTELVVLDEKPFRVKIETHLIQINGDWKVDYQKTMPALTKISATDKAIDSIKSLGNRLSDSVEKSVQDLKAEWPAFKQQLETLEADAKAKIPELRKKLDEIKKKIEEQIEGEPEQNKADPGRSV